MSSDCKILTAEEEDQVVSNSYNFRRWTPEELQQKHSPFERTQKKEFPFLFQKKRVVERKDVKTSLEDICAELKDTSITLYESHTPPYPPSPLAQVINPTSEVLVDLSNNMIVLEK